MALRLDKARAVNNSSSDKGRVKASLAVAGASNSSKVQAGFNFLEGFLKIRGCTSVELNGSIDGGNLVLRGTSWRIGLLIFVLAFLIAFEVVSA